MSVIDGDGAHRASCRNTQHSVQEAWFAALRSSTLCNLFKARQVNAMCLCDVPACTGQHVLDKAVRGAIKTGQHVQRQVGHQQKVARREMRGMMEM